MPRLVWTFLSKSSITSAAGCARVGGKALWLTTTTTRVLFPGVPSQLLPPLVQHSIRHHTRHGYLCVTGSYRVRTYTHTHVGLQCQSMLFSSPPTFDGQKMPLGLSSYYFFARSLVRSLAFCLSPSISSCYKKDNFFYIFVAFPCCLSQTPVFFFYPLKVKRERIKNKHTPERTRGERGV